jgi:hypothetical protein
MIRNKELYGTDDVPPIPKEIADERMVLLQANLEREVDKPFSEHNPSLQLEIMKAIRFWKKLSRQEDAGL